MFAELETGKLSRKCGKINSSRSCTSDRFINSRRQPLKRLLFRCSPFYDSKRSIGVNFDAGNETRENI